VPGEEIHDRHQVPKPFLGRDVGDIGGLFHDNQVDQRRPARGARHLGVQQRGRGLLDRLPAAPQGAGAGRGCSW
jgi:hypothetical protein